MTARASKPPYLVRVMTAPDVEKPFCAGLIIDNEVCTQAAPILWWCEGKSAAWLSGHFKYRGWKATVVRDRPAEPDLFSEPAILLGMAGEEVPLVLRS
jgi:hypothetical protein